MAVSKRKPLIFLTVLAALAGLAFLVLHQQGYFKDPAVALRELEERGVTPDEDSVRKAIIAKDHELITTLSRAGTQLTGADDAGRTSVHLAIQFGDIKTLELLKGLTAKGDLQLNTPDSEQRVPLHDALALERVDRYLLATWLLKHGAEVNFPVKGEPAVISYYEQDQTERLGFLISHGADLNVAGSDKITLLDRAIRKGDAKATTLFLKNGASPTPELLRQAYEAGRPDLFTALLQYKSDPNGTAASGEPFLIQLIADRSANRFPPETCVAFLDALIDHGVKIEKRGTQGQNPAVIAIKTGFSEARDYLLQHTKDLTGCLPMAVEIEDTTAFAKLLERGADVTEKFRGEPLLFVMIKRDDASAVTQLIKHGANLEELGLEGQRPLATALAAGKEKAALALISGERRADIEAILEAPVTEEFRSLFRAKSLLDWYCCNESQLRPIHIAVMKRNLAGVEKLLEFKADRFAATKRKVYPIQMAAASADIKMQQLLIGVSYRDEDQKRHFIIDLSDQQVSYFKDGELVKKSRISSGMKGFRTKPGKYVITDKTKNKRSNIYNNAKMPYFQRFSCGAIGFHEGYTGSRFASHGCIRLPMSTAKFFWKETQLGDRVTIQK